MHVANQLLFKALIILGKKLFPNLSVLHFKRVNWLKFFNYTHVRSPSSHLNNAKCVPLMQFFSLLSHRVNISTYVQPMAF